MSAVMIAVLPGPDRKRTQSLYRYHLTHRSEGPGPGCLAQWAVEGGRLSYQVALERDDQGRLHWHCTCADAVYRGEDDAHHVCKHVRGLHEFGLPLGRRAG
jgi:hypothetical protein